MGKTPPSRHDRSHRLFFSHPQMIEDLLRGFVAEPWVEELDFSTLSQLPSDFVSRGLDERVGDVVWKVEWKRRGARPLYVYIQLELQSSPDPEMALRVLVYVGLFYQRLLKAEPRAPGEKLPPVLPIVLYNGEAAWSAPLDVAEMIEPASSGLERYRPSLRHLVIDERRVPEDLLAGVRNLVAALIRLERSEGPREVRAVVSDLLEWLQKPEQRGLRQTFTTWLRLVLLPERQPEADLPEVEDLNAFTTILEANVQTWSEIAMQKGLRRGRREGLLKGMKKGEAAFLLRLIERRFGAPEPAVRRRIERADAEQLLAWGERLLDAESLADLLGEELR